MAVARYLVKMKALSRKAKVNLFFAAVWKIHARPKVAVVLGDLAVPELEILGIAEHAAVVGIPVVGHEGIVVSHDHFFEVEPFGILGVRPAFTMIGFEVNGFINRAAETEPGA